MKKRSLAAILAAALLLSGCSTLLERSYSMVEPYADRYWDSSAEDTLRVDNYQDLVNSLLMLIEQRAEEAVIRCYDEVNVYQEVSKSRNEVRWETMLGSYLLQNIQFTFEEGANYSTATFLMTYREDAEDLAGIMTLSDSQSLVDLLRLAVREDHGKMTARFTYDTPREAVSAAVESYWQELCRDEMEADAAQQEIPAAAPEDEPEDVPGPTDGAGGTDGPEPLSEEPDTGGGEVSEEGPPEEGEPEEPEPIVYPPCPWTVRFYPDRETAELVEILLRQA